MAENSVLSISDPPNSICRVTFRKIGDFSWFCGFSSNFKVNFLEAQESFLGTFKSSEKIVSGILEICYHFGLSRTTK